MNEDFGPPQEIVVVVPVHNEERLLARCLGSVQAAARHLTKRVGVTARLVVVLDDCTDRSEEIAAAHHAETVHISRRSVGAARAAGVDHIVRTTAVTRVWIACTDADSRVPIGWLLAQSRQAAAGADLVLGRARLDPADVSIAVYRRWARRYAEGGTSHHIHGANLGVSLDAYWRVGGFADLEEHEDVDLVGRLREVGARVAPVPDVLTSGRLDGRTPGGFAGFLRHLGVASEPRRIDPPHGLRPEPVIDAPEHRLRTGGHPDTRV